MDYLRSKPYHLFTTPTHIWFPHLTGASNINHSGAKGIFFQTLGRDCNDIVIIVYLLTEQNNMN